MPKSRPRLWWDFYGRHSIIVESDDDRYPVLALYVYASSDAELAIEMAKDLIDSIDSGRLSISKAYTGLTKEKLTGFADI